MFKTPSANPLWGSICGHPKSLNPQIWWSQFWWMNDLLRSAHGFLVNVGCHQHRGILLGHVSTGRKSSRDCHAGNESIKLGSKNPHRLRLGVFSPPYPLFFCCLCTPNQSWVKLGMISPWIQKNPKVGHLNTVGTFKLRNNLMMRWLKLGMQFWGRTCNINPCVKIED